MVADIFMAAGVFVLLFLTLGLSSEIIRLPKPRPKPRPEPPKWTKYDYRNRAK